MSPISGHIGKSWRSRLGVAALLPALATALLLALLGGSACAAPESAAALKLEPAELTLSNDSWGSRPSITVKLVGPEAEKFANVHYPPPRTVVLYDTHNRQAKVNIGKFTGSGNVVTAKLSLEKNASPGRYSGEVTLLPGALESPRLKLTVASHLPSWLAFLLVVAGVLIGVPAKALYALHARRDVLLKAVAEADDRVNEVSKKLGGQRDVVTRVTWYLTNLATAPGQETKTTPGEESPWLLPTGNLSGVAALRERIEEARNDKDLEGDTEATLEVIARIQRWLRLAPAAWRLELVAEEKFDGTTPSWPSARTWRDTRVLQRQLLYEPQSATEADDLVARILWQIRWHHRLFALHAGAQPEVPAGIVGPALEQLKQAIVDLDLTLPEKSNVLSRTSAERDELDFELERLHEQHIVPESLEASKLGDAPWSVDTPGLEVNWQTTPNLFTGWATLDGSSWLRVRTRAVEPPKRHRPRRGTSRQTPARGERPSLPQARADSRWAVLWPVLPKRAVEPPAGGQRAPLRRAPGAGLGWAVLWSVLPVLAASIVYAATIYSETWGSWLDIATAVAAGFVGKVTVDLATLPVFQSRRLLPSAKPTTPALAATAPSAPPAPAPASHSS